jgi:hypothetical protein
MSVANAGVRLALGLFIVMHGLAHTAVMDTALFEPGLLARDFMPVILTAVAVVGFTVAGIGIALTNPVLYAVRPVLVVASVYSLVAIFRMGAANPWLGAGVDVALLLLGLTGAYRWLPGTARPAVLAHR